MQSIQSPKGYKCSTHTVTTPQIQHVYRTPKTDRKQSTDATSLLPHTPAIHATAN
jgi:hypothetical protein